MQARDGSRAKAAEVGGLVVAEVLVIFERHGLRYHDDDHTSRAILLVREAAHTYDAQLDRPAVMRPHSHGLTNRQLHLLAEMCENARICVTTGIETCQRCDRSESSRRVRGLHLVRRRWSRGTTVSELSPGVA